MEAVEIVSKEYGRRRNTWSPEQIACTPTRFSMPSLLTIYRCIYDRYLLNGDLEVLRCKEKFIRMRGRPVQRWEEADHWWLIQLREDKKGGKCVSLPWWNERHATTLLQRYRIERQKSLRSQSCYTKANLTLINAGFCKAHKFITAHNFGILNFKMCCT